MRDSGAQRRRPSDDAELARAAAAGSRDALGSLYQRYAGEVYRLAYRLTGTRADAEDTLQDVFAGLPRALERYREEGKFRAWLRQVAARTALSRIRSDRRHVFEPLEGVDLPPREPAGEAVDRIALSRALAEMPASQRLVFLLKEVEGYDHAEIGALLSIRPGTARVRLYRAWRFLENRIRGQR